MGIAIRSQSVVVSRQVVYLCVLQLSSSELPSVVATRLGSTKAGGGRGSRTRARSLQLADERCKGNGGGRGVVGQAGRLEDQFSGCVATGTR